MSAPKRIFSDEQLTSMAARPIDELMAAIDAGETERAKALAQTSYDSYAHLHDGYMCWIAGLLTYIYEQDGVQGVEAAERFAHGLEAKLVFVPPEKTDVRSMVEKMSAELQGHVHQFMSLEEDDEKIVLTNRPCGSGGRLIQMGAYEPEVGMARITEPADITFGTADFPVYCVHCALFNINALDDFGDFIFLNDPPTADGDHCRFIFYKDKADIPESYYTRLGRKKPEYDPE